MAKGGYAGRILSVNLTTGDIEVVLLDEALKSDFLGGHGINAKLLYDLVKPGTDPLSPDNVLIFGAGPLVGTMYPTASRASAMAKSPLSGLISMSNAGHFGQMLKFAGFDHLIIKGRADKPVYLRINDDDVQIADASHLWGKDNYETTDTLWAQLGSDHWVSSIGQAGENLVKFANIMTNKHSVFARTGLGAVMGSKKLKAIAIRGTKRVTVQEPGKFMKLVNQKLRAISEHTEEVEFARKMGSIAIIIQGDHMSQIQLPPAGHRDTEARDLQKYMGAFRLAAFACPGCPIGCKHWLEPKDGKPFAVSCTAGTLAMPGIALSISTWAEMAKTTELSQRYGMDTIDTCALITLAIELQEKGILTKKDTDGLQLGWGRAEEIRALIRRIAFREGLGDALADGTKGACEKIGQGSAGYGMAIKGVSAPERLTPDLRSKLYHQMTFGRVVNPRGNTPECYKNPWMPPKTGERDAIRAAVRKAASVIGLPPDATQRMLADVPAILAEQGYNVPRYTKFVEQYCAVVNSLGLCDRPYESLAEVTGIEMLSDAYSAVIGQEVSAAEQLQAADRIWNVQRAFNIRQGGSRKDDQLPERFLREPLVTEKGEYPPARSDDFNILLDEYYEEHGWDPKTGKPGVEKLQWLGLEGVVKDIW